MKKFRYFMIICIMLIFIAQIGCKSVHFEKIYDNDYFGFEYPPLLIVTELEGTDVVLSEIGNPNPMMVFQILEYKKLKKGDIQPVKERYLKVPAGIPEPEVKIQKINGVKSLYYQGWSFGGTTTTEIFETFGYYVPLDDMVLFIQINPQVQDDLELGHKIVKTVKIK